MINIIKNSFYIFLGHIALKPKVKVGKKVSGREYETDKISDIKKLS